MRTVIVLTAVLGCGVLAGQQPMPPAVPENPQPRFGVPHRPKGYPQATPKETLAGVVRALERTTEERKDDEVRYLLAHLMDPRFVDERVGDRAKQLERGVTDRLLQRRARQKQNPGAIPFADRVSDDPVQFQGQVAREAEADAFRQLVEDVRTKLLDDPEILRDFRTYNFGLIEPKKDDPKDAEPKKGETVVQGDGTGVKLTHPRIKDRAVFLRKIGERWFIENRQVDDVKKTPEK